MDEEPIILPSANRHGVKDEDLLHALENALHYVNQDDGMVMWIGPDRAGALTEVGVIEWHGLIAVAHAMTPARNKYLR